jgi:hypothetical protein
MSGRWATVYDGHPWTEMDLEDPNARPSRSLRSKTPRSIYANHAQSKTFAVGPKSWG